MIDEAPRYCGTRMLEAPTITGRTGQAWRVRLAPLGQRDKPDHDATVGLYVVRAPGVHPFWDHYMFSLVHLRPIAGVKPAHVTIAGATHEFMIVSLNPEQPLPSLDAGKDWKVAFLTPFDVTEQFAAADDAVADQILELAVKVVVDGLASPDQDWRSWWSTAIAQTASHFGNGSHTVPRA